MLTLHSSNIIINAMIFFCCSLNKIKSLADFQHCRNLVELYVRRNEIRDLSELCYLQDLPRLKRLLLAENPCVDSAGSATALVHFKINEIDDFKVEINFRCVLTHKIF